MLSVLSEVGTPRLTESADYWEEPATVVEGVTSAAGRFSQLV
jgi:hypothetical protein